MEYLLKPDTLGDLAFLLRTLQSLCTVAASFERDEHRLDLMRERLQCLLDCTGGEGVYPDRAGEVWTEYSGPCEEQCAKRYGMIEVARPGRSRVCNEDVLIADARAVAAELYDECTERIDRAARGVCAYRLCPTFYDAVADVADLMRGDKTPSTLIRIYLGLTECMRGAVDPSRHDTVMRLNALCKTCADALQDACERVKPFSDGIALYRELCEACIKDGLTGAHPVWSDCMLRFSLRAERLYRTGK